MQRLQNTCYQACNQSGAEEATNYGSQGLRVPGLLHAETQAIPWALKLCMVAMCCKQIYWNRRARCNWKIRTCHFAVRMPCAVKTGSLKLEGCPMLLVVSWPEQLHRRRVPGWPLLAEVRFCIFRSTLMTVYDRSQAASMWLD